MKDFNVVGIGNAMVDVLAQCDEGFLGEHGIDKGIMQLIDMDRAVDLYSRIGPAREISGGSAANTIAGIAHLGSVRSVARRSNGRPVSGSIEPSRMICPLGSTSGPWPPDRHVALRARRALDCAPCLARRCGHPEGPVCMSGISAEEVCRAVEDQLGRT